MIIEPPIGETGMARSRSTSVHRPGAKTATYDPPGARGESNQLRGEHGASLTVVRYTERKNASLAGSDARMRVSIAHVLTPKQYFQRAELLRTSIERAKASALVTMR